MQRQAIYNRTHRMFSYTKADIPRGGLAVGSVACSFDERLGTAGKVGIATNHRGEVCCDSIEGIPAGIAGGIRAGVVGQCLIPSLYQYLLNRIF